jgi:ATP-dependent DNA helicase RecG
MTVAEVRRSAATLPGSAGGAEEETLRREVTVIGEVRSFRVLGVGRKARLVLVLGDPTGTLQCVWFGGVQYWKKAFQLGEILAVSGQPTFYGGILQFVHPDIDKIRARSGEGEGDVEEDVDWGSRLNTGGLVPLYPSGQDLARVGLDSGGFRRVIHQALERHAGQIDEILPEEIISGRALISLRTALQDVHFPKDRDRLDPALRRLKYQELFLFQLRLARKRRARKEERNGFSFDPKSTFARRLVDALPFRLTAAQIRVIREITGDLGTGQPMNRLLQGDVGSGKTVVALLAMLVAADNGYQSAFLAPTEVLADQHYRTLRSLLGDLPVRVRLLVGAQRTGLRRDILEDVRGGDAQIVVGTHALLEKSVSFARLGLVVIDEQHRFGVLQRAALREKGGNPHVLVMTATPIPRTLSLTLYGDLDVSVINELPKDRRPIQTVLRDEESLPSVYRFVRDEIAKGRQAYFVYPLVEESERLELKAATTHLHHLQGEVFPDLRVGLLHGRMTAEEKDAMMRSFKAGEVQVLVATTVIEVGIDVPNATVMVVEDAERFGLSQLHQLRGRVGRGADQSYCLLLTKRWIAQRARRSGTAPSLSLEEHRLAEARLAAMVETTDGFVIAERDLRLRGPGDYFGTRQSGVPQFSVADIVTDGGLLDLARQDAFALIERDPRLASSQHERLATFLHELLPEESSIASAG